MNITVCNFRYTHSNAFLEYTSKVTNVETSDIKILTLLNFVKSFEREMQITVLTLI